MCTLGNEKCKDLGGSRCRTGILQQFRSQMIPSWGCISAENAIAVEGLQGAGGIWPSCTTSMWLNICITGILCVPIIVVHWTRVEACCMST